MAQFKELGRINITETKNIVANQLIEDGEMKGVHFNTHIITAKYEGFAQGGLFIPANKLEEFGELIKTVLAIKV